MTDKQVDKHGSLSRRQLITGGAIVVDSLGDAFGPTSEGCERRSAHARRGQHRRRTYPMQ